MSLLKDKPIYATSILKLPEEGDKGRRDRGVNIDEDERRYCMQSILHVVGMVIILTGYPPLTIPLEEILPESDKGYDNDRDFGGRQSGQSKV